MMKTTLALCMALAASACATNTGIVPAGNGTSMVSAQAATGFSGMSDLRAGVMRQAADHCNQTGQDFSVVDIHEAKPPFILGNFPRIDLTFRCIPKS